MINTKEELVRPFEDSLKGRPARSRPATA